MLNNCPRISSGNDLIKFISALTKDLKENPDEWGNKDLPSYLEAMTAWMEDMDGYYENTNQELPKDINWKVISDILMAARVYE